MEKRAEIVSTHDEAEDEDGGVVAELNHLIVETVFNGFEEITHEGLHVCCNEDADDHDGQVLNDNVPEELILFSVHAE